MLALLRQNFNAVEYRNLSNQKKKTTKSYPLSLKYDTKLWNEE